MNVQEINEKLLSDEYDFLRKDKNLGNNIILLTTGGSHAYGTNKEGSDLDIRGCALNSKRQILTNEHFEQFTNEETDTTIYGFNKLMTLLSNCNPNTIEMLGNRADHYFYVSPIGQQLIDNRHMFLSKKAVYSFGGYANQQLKRLGYNPEIFMDRNLKKHPLKDYVGMVSETQNIIRACGKIEERNEHTIEHNKLGKHMMHLVRLYMMCLDILEKEEIVTYREKEHDLLMDIRNSKYLDEDGQPMPCFFEIVNEYEKRLDYAKENTSLPDVPDYGRINDFIASVNEQVVKQDGVINTFSIKPYEKPKETIYEYDI